MQAQKKNAQIDEESENLHLKKDAPETRFASVPSRSTCFTFYEFSKKRKKQKTSLRCQAKDMYHGNDEK